MLKRLEEKNAEYRQKWKEEESKTEELTKHLRSAQLQVDEAKTKLSSLPKKVSGGGGGDDDVALTIGASAPTTSTVPSSGGNNSNVMEDLRRDLVGAARDLCCRILDNLIDKCEKTTTSVSTSPGALEDAAAAASKVVSPEEVVNASIVLREDKIIEIVARKEKEAKKSAEELREVRKMLEEERMGIRR